MGYNYLNARTYFKHLEKRKVEPWIESIDKVKKSYTALEFR